MNPSKTRKMKLILKMIILIISCFLLLFTQINMGSACSVITTSTDSEVWFGYNEDRYLEQFNQETFVRFHSNTSTIYAFMEVTAEAPNLFSVRVGMNSKGVAISGNYVPPRQINPHPEKLYSWRYNSSYRLILQYCANISDAINLVQNFEFPPSMAFQIHIADADGNAIVISPGPDGEIVIIQKITSFMVSTNSNRADIEIGSSDLRNDVATSMLETNDNLGKELMKSVLDSVHQESYEGCTYYSSIFDLKRRNAFFYLMHDYNQEANLNISQELLLGDHYYLMSDLFPDGARIWAIAKGQMEFQQIIDVFSRLLSLVLSILVLAHLAISIHRTRKISYKTSTKLIDTVKSSSIHALAVFVIILSGIFIPAICLTNFLDRVFQTQTFSFELLLILLWAIGSLILCVLAFMKMRARKIEGSIIHR